ncbi:FAD:protein FMN transferase [Kribbella sp. NPDC058245]|uniref:FAD:protein FMN transferase n=1 Tax=Kribbella sp. NPDC058245 TaxID=3346399 RepID=UPI0036E8815E
MSASRTWTAWSCTVRVTVDDPAVLGAACGELKALMDRVDKAASRFRSDSELSIVNQRSGAMVPVSRLLVDLVDVSLMAASISGGAVDPTVGTAVIAAGYDDDIETVRRRLAQPVAQPVALTATVPGWQQVQLNRKLALLGVPEGAVLDLGATAKAWTADRAALILSKRYGCAVLVEIGGDLCAAGQPDEPWVITVAERAGDPGVLVTLAHGGLTTSTRTSRCWENGHHIIDPRTGRPADGPWRTASVWAPTAVRANTFSTALIATGEAAVGRLTLAGHPARIVANDGEVTELAGWPASTQAA